MKTLKTRTTLAILSLAIAACEDVKSPVEPFGDDLLTVAEEVELAVLADQAAVDMAVELVETNATVASRRGHQRAGEGHELSARARLRFANAQDALQRGERRLALDEARAARRLVTRGIRATGGDQAVRAMVERIEDVALTAVDNPDSYDDASAVSSELGSLAADARSALNGGDVERAGERALLGEQRARSRRPGHRDRPGDVTPERAELAVALGATAVALAERLLGDGADEEQMRFLATAHEFLEKARTAFAEGNYQRAVHFAELASWSALKAVVLPGGITEEEIRAMSDLANSLYEEAVIAVGDDPTEIEAKMLEKAKRLIELGDAKIADGHVRGIGALWQGAVISSWLIG